MSALDSLLARLPAASPLPFALNESRCYKLDLSASNAAAQGLDPADTSSFATTIRAQMMAAGADYAAGGYPGVCAVSEGPQWLANCPDPNLLLRIAALAG